jgi:hypothetical protein
MCTVLATATLKVKVTDVLLAVSAENFTERFKLFTPLLSSLEGHMTHPS